MHEPGNEKFWFGHKYTDNQNQGVQFISYWNHKCSIAFTPNLTISSFLSDFLATPTSPDGGIGCGEGCVLSAIIGAFLAVCLTLLHD